MGWSFNPAAGMGAEIFLYIAVKAVAVNRADGRKTDPRGCPVGNKFPLKNQGEKNE
jgi:hypothetical protein